MALTKHQKLAKALREMLHRVNTFYDKAEEALNLIQFHFHEPFFLTGRPLMRKESIDSMMKLYYVGLKFFAYPKQLPEKWSGAIVTPPLYPASCILTSEDSQDCWFIPWRVKTIWPNSTQADLQHHRIEALLYSPSEIEIPSWVEWEEEEDPYFSMTSQVHLLIDLAQEQSKLKANLAQSAFELFKVVVEKWEEDVTNRIKHYPQDFSAIKRTPFAPNAETSIALAYEAIMAVQSSGRYRNYSELIRSWKICLEELIFENLDWNEAKKQEFLSEWEHRFLRKSPHHRKVPGRWKTAYAIDRLTAARFIRYFVERFISKPSNRHAGEIALILMTLVWISHHSHACTSVKAIVDLRCFQINTETEELNVGTMNFEISEGLYSLLAMLAGDKATRTTSLLFRHVSLDRLEDALKIASREVLGEDADSVSPAAFLCFPHFFPQQRLCAAQRQALRIGKKMDSYSFTRRSILRLLQGKSST